MRVFLTGATGFIGSAVADELLAAGHQVTGLAKDDTAASRLNERGVAAHRGDLSDLDSIAAGATVCDGVIHTAFINDFSRYTEVAEIDRRVVAAIVDALAESGKPFVATSVVSLLAPDRLGTELDARASPDIPRAASEATVLAAADRGVRASAVRLPFSVHGRGDTGFVPALVDLARRKRVAAYIGDGANRWPAVNRLDAARLFRLALESADPGAVLHAVAEEGVAMRAIAEAIGRGLDLPVRSVAEDDVDAHFGWLARFVSMDQPISSALTRNWTDWSPRQNDLLTDIAESGYCEAASRSKL